MRSRRISAFSLLELLVVISIIAMLLAMLMPSLQSSREQAKRVACMANLHSVGQSLYLYAHDYRDMLVPGECQTAWDVWSKPTEGPACGTSPGSGPVNLGHLLDAEKLPIPTGKNHVFFCPSGNNPNGGLPYNSFKLAWGKDNARAAITYMFNNSLDGFDDYIESGTGSVIFHKDKINFLLGDGSVQVFNDKKMIYDKSIGAEGLAQVCSRTGNCFPTSMLHGWFERGSIDIDEAVKFQANPKNWAVQASTGTLAKPVMLSNLSKRSLVADVVGSWMTSGQSRSTAPG